MTNQTETILAFFDRRGADGYSGEAVTQEAHALQSAALAEAAGAEEPLVVAALLHDLGHLIHNAGESLAARGVDARHEVIAATWLVRHFGPAVVEPVRLHVPAKRYLCATDPAYHASLSAASQRSLAVQGGAFDVAEAGNFAALPFTRDAVELRRWDDLAKTPDAPTRRIGDYADMIRRVAAAHPPG
ncbi:MAG: phosphonate degradation HD-domain oxygenase [Aliidongia sp.]